MLGQITIGEKYRKYLARWGFKFERRRTSGMKIFIEDGLQIETVPNFV